MFYFAKKFAEDINSCINESNIKNDGIAIINDFCNYYIALFGYIYLLKKVLLKKISYICKRSQKIDAATVF